MIVRKQADTPVHAPGLRLDSKISADPRRGGLAAGWYPGAQTRSKTNLAVSEPAPRFDGME
jgi:hypothetical protein